MIAAFEALLARRWRVVASAALVAVGVVVVWSYLTPKQWEASTTVLLDPLVVPGLHEDAASPATPTEDEAFATELATARGATFQEGLRANAAYPFTVTVDAGPREATLRLTARADSAERASAASYSAANGFTAWGRSHEAVARRDALQREVDALPAGDPAAADLEARLQTAATAVDRLSAGGGTVVVRPAVPGDPVSPNLTARIVLAAVVGLLVGVAAAALLDRRHATPAGAAPRAGAGAVAGAGAAGDRPEGVGGPPHGQKEAGAVTDRAGVGTGRRLARLALGGVAVVALLVPAASVVAGVVQVWELRPSTNAQDEAGYACFPGWLDDLPDGTLVGISEDSPRFFYDHVQEFAYPRLAVAPPGVVPEVLVNIVAGPGPEACAGFHREVSRP